MDYIREIRKKVGNEKIILNFVGGYIKNNEGEILLQKRKDKNVWGFPGGAIELGESIEEALVREILEETGLQIKMKSLIGIYSKYEDSYPNGDKVQPISYFFELELLSGKLSTQDEETLGLKYFKENNMPPLVNKQHEDFFTDLKNYDGQVFIR
ncbi:NUDIX hydrolase [Listeria valentina]|uniref:NUDIX hydrolase n=1 Tax=Listeria valentina TaxID=2705293 RepID=UPI0014319DC4|nr:NUDIX domain-containing protein [Listeria valentina]